MTYCVAERLDNGIIILHKTPCVDHCLMTCRPFQTCKDVTMNLQLLSRTRGLHVHIESLCRYVSTVTTPRSDVAVGNAKQPAVTRHPSRHTRIQTIQPRGSHDETNKLQQYGFLLILNGPVRHAHLTIVSLRSPCSLCAHSAQNHIIGGLFQFVIEFLCLKIFHVWAQALRRETFQSKV